MENKQNSLDVSDIAELSQSDNIGLMAPFMKIIYDITLRRLNRIEIKQDIELLEYAAMEGALSSKSLELVRPYYTNEEYVNSTAR